MNDSVEDLIKVAKAVLDRWDAFVADEGCVNPLEYLDGDQIEPLRDAINKLRN